MKPNLTFNERIKSAFLYFVHGTEQQILERAFETNVGRVSEACQAIEIAANHPKLVIDFWKRHEEASVKAVVESLAPELLRDLPELEAKALAKKDERGR